MTNLVPWRKSNLGSWLSNTRRTWEDLDRAMDDMFRDFGFSTLSELGAPSFVPNIEVQKNKDSVVLSVEIPGMEKDDIKITIENNQLTISGEKKSSTEKKDGDKTYWSECSYGAFYRSINLPENAITDKVAASCKNGVLTITVPTEETKEEVKKIEVKVEDK